MISTILSTLCASFTTRKVRTADHGYMVPGGESVHLLRGLATVLMALDLAVVSLSLLLLCPATLLGQHLALRQKAVGTPAKLTTQQQELLVRAGPF